MISKNEDWKIYGSFTYKSPKKFFDYGTCIDREYVTYDIVPDYRGKHTLLKDVIVKAKHSIPKEYFVNKRDLKNIILCYLKTLSFILIHCKVMNTFCCGIN